MQTSLHILFVFDTEHDHAILRNELAAEATFHIISVSSPHELATHHADKRYDLTLCTLDGDSGDDQRKIADVRAYCSDAPVIVVAAPDQEERAAQALEYGVYDYILETPLQMRRLPRVIHAAVELARLREEQRRSRDELQIYTRALASTNDGILITGSNKSDNPIVYCNSAFERLTGYTYDEVIGKNCRFLQGPESEPEVARHIRAAIANGQACNAVITNYRKDGSKFFNSLSIAPMHDDHDDITHFIGIQKDVSEQVYAERASLRASQRFAIIFYFSPISIIISTLADGRIIDVNNNVLRVSGYSREELLDHTTEELNLWPDPDQRRQIQQVLQTQDSIEGLELAFRTKNGALRDMQISFARIMLDDVDEPCLLAMAYDISEYKRVNRRLQQYSQRVQMLAELSRALAEVGLDYNAVLKLIAHRASEFLGDLCMIRLLSGQWLQLVAFHHTNPASASLIRSIASVFLQRPDDGLSGWAIHSGKPFFLAEVDQEKLEKVISRAYLPYVDRVGISSLIIAPMRVHNKVTGVIWLSRDRSGDAYTHEDLIFAQELADYAALAITNARLYKTMKQELSDRRQAEAALRESEERYRALFDRNVAVKLVINPTTGMILEANAAASAFYGYSLSALQKMYFRDISLLSDEEIEQWMAEALQGPQKPFIFPQRLRSGEIRDVEVYSGPIEVQDKDVFFLIIHDITERNRTEGALRESEARFRQLAENIREIFWLWTPNQEHLLYVSPTYEYLWSRPNVEVYADPASRLDVIHPDDRAHVVAALAEARRNNYLTEYEEIYRIVPESNQIRWIRERLFPICNAEGEVYRVAGVSEDITDAKLAEIHIQQNAERAEALARIAAHLNARLDLQTTLRTICEDTIDILGIPSAFICLYDEQQQKLCYAGGVGIHAASAEESIRDSCPYHVETINLERTVAVQVVLDVQIPPWFSPDTAGHKMLRANMVRDNELIGVISLLPLDETREFTENELMLIQGVADQAALAITNARLFDTVEQERALLAQRVEESTIDLRRLNVQLERAARLKDEFLAGMSHELRTPLNAVLGYAESLQEQLHGPLNEHQLQALQRIEESGRHLLALINDILDVAKIEAGTLDIDTTDVSVKSLCESSVRLIMQTARKKNITVSTRIDPEVTRIQGDGRRLKQVLVNLLSNAVKFTNEGGLIGLEVEGDSEIEIAYFSVWDTGIGISEADMERLFQPFVQLDSSLSRQYNGTGLGLALVARMAELHGGSVSVESVVGQGSRFIVSLPWRPPIGSSSDDVPGSEDDKHQVSPAPTAIHITHALIITSDQAIADQITTCMGDQETELMRPGKLEEVLNYVRRRQPEVIFLDAEYPDPPGLAILTGLSGNLDTQGVPVILAATIDTLAQKEAVASTAYLLKPVDRTQIDQALQEAVNRLQGEHPQRQGDFGLADQPMTILLAEDNETTITMFRDYLTELGYRIEIARDGEEALASAHNIPPDLVLMDIQMPGIDGMEAIRRMRASADLAHIPIIALTALAMPGDRERCLEAGANAYLSKPVRLVELVNLIETNLNQLAAKDASDG